MKQSNSISTATIAKLIALFHKATSLLISILFTLSTGIVYANPTGGEVVSGSASISSSGNRMDINQGSDRAVLNWQDFSIGNNEQVNFNQPGKGSVALNRVVGANLSNIQGKLTANGNVFIVNRNGVVFGANSRVDVNGLMATTSAISNDDFMAGRMNFTAPGGAVGSIVNEGTITVAEGGLVAFVAPSVRNAGVINARLGKVALAAGEQFTLDMYGDDLIKVAVSDALAKQLVENSGQINADGGVVSLTASQAKSAVDDVINMSGSIQAKSVAQRDGKIILSGGGGGVLVAGTLDSSSDSGAGGDIDVLGSQINLTDKAKLNASGTGGGGEVHIGGDYQGKGQRPRASKTRINPGAQIMADATASGNGGRIIVWSDDHTKVDGSLSARGGKSGGDGGLIETSSAGMLDFSRQAKVEARGSGKPGTWLLDPEDITIGSGQAKAISSTLNNGGNVSIKTASQGSGEGNIKVNAAIRKTKGGNASLSMRAHNKIDVNAPITSTSGKLNVRLKAGRSINVNAKVSTNGGGFSTSITGVKPTESNEGNTSDTSTDDSKSRDKSEQEVPIADNTDTNANESTESDVADTTDNNPTRPKSDRSKPKSDERVADQGDDQATQDAVDQVQTTVATTDVSVTVPEPVTPPVQVVTQIPEPTRTNTAPRATVATTATVPAVVEPNADPSPVKRQAVGITINKVVNSGGGSIAIDAGNTGTATINSKLDASNTQSGKTGGNINVLGNKVVLTKKAKLDASGDAGGGDVKVGGAYQGKGSTRTAKTTTVNKGATIKSNAITNGDGGEVVVWADKSTDYQGHIEAKGGKQGGDGGSVEVSGKQNLKFNGTVDTSAAKGKTGTLLLDPTDLTITNTGLATDTVNELDVATINSLGANNNVDVQVTDDIVFARFDNDAAIPQDVAVTLAQALGKTVAFKSTNGSIVFANPGDTLQTSGANLSFDAGKNIILGNLETLGGQVNINQSKDINGHGNVFLKSIKTAVDPNAKFTVDTSQLNKVSELTDYSLAIEFENYDFSDLNTGKGDNGFDIIGLVVDEFGEIFIKNYTTGKSTLIPTNIAQVKGSDININSDQGNIILNESINSGSAIIKIEAGKIISSTNKNVVLDTTIRGDNVSGLVSGMFDIDSQSTVSVGGSDIRTAGFVQLKAAKINLLDPSENYTSDPNGFNEILDDTNSNIISIGFDIEATDSKGESIGVSQDGFTDVYTTNSNSHSVNVRLYHFGQNRIPNPNGELPKILNVNNLKIDGTPYSDVFNLFYQGGNKDGQVMLESPNSDGTVSTSAQVPLNLKDNAFGLIACPPCIPDTNKNSDNTSSVNTRLVSRPIPTTVTTSLSPTIPKQIVATSSEVDRETDRTIISSNDEGELGVSTLTNDECAAFDALNWLASGPRDATSSVDLGRSSGQSSQSDIARMAACLTRDSQAAL